MIRFYDYRPAVLAGCLLCLNANAQFVVADQVELDQMEMATLEEAIKSVADLEQVAELNVFDMSAQYEAFVSLDAVALGYGAYEDKFVCVSPSRRIWTCDQPQRSVSVKFQSHSVAVNGFDYASRALLLLEMAEKAPHSECLYPPSFVPSVRSVSQLSNDTFFLRDDWHWVRVKWDGYSPPHALECGGVLE